MLRKTPSPQIDLSEVAMVAPYWGNPDKVWDETFDHISKDSSLEHLLFEDQQAREKLWEKCFQEPPIKYWSYLNGCFQWLRFATWLKGKFPNHRFPRILHLASIKITEESPEYKQRKEKFYDLIS